jgi:phosphoribosylformylglycinamidine synthase
LKTGLLFADPSDNHPATLFWNDHGRYEARWVTVQADGGPCVFLRGVRTMYLPMAHAEGKFMTGNADAMRRLDVNGQLALRYIVPESHRAVVASTARAINGGTRTDSDSENVPFPFNPNGSELAVAGFCDPTGRAFGLMPHPERFIQPTQHPRWTREGLQDEGDGILIFRNAVEFFAT